MFIYNYEKPQIDKNFAFAFDLINKKDGLLINIFGRISVISRSIYITSSLGMSLNFSLYSSKMI